MFRRSPIFLLLISLYSSILLGQVAFDTHIVSDYLLAAHGAQGVTTCDIDGDGDLDVVTCSNEDAKLSWYENLNGLGALGPRIEINQLFQFGVSRIKTEDIDNDGDCDIFFSGLISNGWVENLDGRGNFGDFMTLESGFQVGNKFDTADFNGDGHIDYITCGTLNNKTGIYYNQGNGNFGSPDIISEVDDPVITVAGDIDNDGDPDILLLTYSGIYLFENIIGNIQSKDPVTQGLDRFQYADLADLDGDSDLDILVTYEDEPTMTWFENINGAFEYGEERLISSQLTGLSEITTADIDKDGDIDILATAAADNTLYLFENINGQGSFGTGIVLTSTMTDARRTDVADLDGDGDNDIFLAAPNGDLISWFRNEDGQLGFSEPMPISAIKANNIQSLLLEDLDADGDLDILCATLEGNSLRWYNNLDSSGTYKEEPIIADHILSPSFVRLDDFNGDTIPDLLVLNEEDNTVSWYPRLQIGIDYGPGQTLNTDALEIKTTYSGDLDGDNDSDIIVGYYAGNGDVADLVWFENLDGLGTFGSSKIIENQIINHLIVITEDVDNDGDLDILSANGNNTSTIYLYENLDGQGNFGESVRISTSSGDKTSMQMADINGDGERDILMGGERFGISWTEKIGPSAYGDNHVIDSPIGSEILAVYPIDIDGDGDLDIALSDKEFVYWVENIDGAGTFGSVQVILENNNIHLIEGGDIDKDGDLDLVVGSTDRNEIEHDHNRILWCANNNFVANQIYGYVNLDINADNCLSDSLGLPNVKVSATENNTSFSTFTTSTGLYQLYPEEGEFDLSVDSSLPNYFDILSQTEKVLFTDVDARKYTSFCVGSLDNINDLSVEIYPTTRMRPGFEVTFRVVVKNWGTRHDDAEVHFEYDQTKLEFLSASQPVSTLSGNIDITFSQIQPLGSQHIDLTFRSFQPPTNEIRQLLEFIATVESSGTDVDPDNNIFSFKNEFIGSFDPNDIAVLEGPQLHIDEADAYLHYVIRFQNTGTASAVNVRVENALDPRLDWSTFEMTSASHAQRVDIRDGQLVNFIFDNIYLPDSTTNEPLSHGFITYKIKPEVDVVIGDIIYNQADIYFDFNTPIITNEVSTVFTEFSHTQEIQQKPYLIYPNPVSDQLFIQTKEALEQVNFYNGVGHLVYREEPKGIAQRAWRIGLPLLDSGIYLVEMVGEKGNRYVDKVIIR